MRFIAKLPFFALIPSVFLASGCVVSPNHDHYRGYDRRADADYRAHERREAYDHCRAAGERNCDDLLRPHN
jgi:hypothetical protein